MSTGWERVLPEVAEAGDVGGDHQISDAYSAQWVRPLHDGQYAVVTCTYYAAESNGQRYMECCTEYVVCTDPSNPGNTELASDSSCDDVRGVDGYSNADARKAAANAANTDEPTDAEWNRMMPGWPVAA